MSYPRIHPSFILRGGDEGGDRLNFLGDQINPRFEITRLRHAECYVTLDLYHAGWTERASCVRLNSLNWICGFQECKQTGRREDTRAITLANASVIATSTAQSAVAADKLLFRAGLRVESYQSKEDSWSPLNAV